MPINVISGSPQGTGMRPYRSPYGRRRPATLDVLEMQQRQQEHQQRMRMDFSYRSAMLRQQQQEFWAEAPQMVDPAAQAQATARAAGGRFGSGSVDQVSAALDARQVQAQQRANARARRMGQPIPYPDAEPHMTAGVTRVDARRAEDRRQELEDAARERREGLEDEERRREWMQEDRTEQGRVNEWQGRASDLQNQADQLIQQAGGTSALTDDGRRAYEELQNDLANYERDQAPDGPHRMTPLQYQRARAQRIQQFLNQWNPIRNVTPPHQRPGYREVTPGGMMRERNADGTFTERPATRAEMSPEQRKAQEDATFGMDRWGNKGQWITDRYGTHFEPYKQEGQPFSQQVTESENQRVKFAEALGKRFGFDPDMSTWGKAEWDKINPLLDQFAPRIPLPSQGQPGQPTAGGAGPLPNGRMPVQRPPGWSPEPQPGYEAWPEEGWVPAGTPGAARAPQTAAPPQQEIPIPLAQSGSAGGVEQTLPPAEAQQRWDMGRSRPPGVPKQTDKFTWDPNQPTPDEKIRPLSSEQSIGLAQSPLGQKTIKEALGGNPGNEMEKTLNNLGITVVRGPEDVGKVPVGGVFVAPDGSVRTRKV